MFRAAPARRGIDRAASIEVDQSADEIALYRGRRSEEACDVEVMEAIHRRRAVREYAEAAVDAETIRALIDAAIWAPTAVDRQAWSFVVVTDRAFLKKYSDAAKAHLLARLAANPHLAGLRGHLTSPEFNIFYGAPVLIVICATDPDPMAAQSACLAAENLMLAACARELGTCWIGLAEDWLNQQAAKSELMIPADHIPVAPIIVGHPLRLPEPPQRHAPSIVWIEGKSERS